MSSSVQGRVAISKDCRERERIRGDEVKRPSVPKKLGTSGCGRLCLTERCWSEDSDAFSLLFWLSATGVPGVSDGSFMNTSRRAERNAGLRFEIDPRLRWVRFGRWEYTALVHDMGATVLSFRPVGSAY